MAQTERVTKDELHEDRFIAFVMEVYDFMRRQAKVLIAAVVILVIALAAVSLYLYQQEQSGQAASLKMGESLAAFTEGETNWLDPAKKGESTAKLEEARDTFQSVFKDHSGSVYDDKALFYHAKTLTYLGEYDQALQSLQKLVTEHAQSLFALHGQLAIGQVYAQKGQPEDLQRAVDELAPEKFNRFAQLPLQEREQVLSLALLERAGYYEKLNQPENALKNYRQITDTFEANLQQLVTQRSQEAIQSVRHLLDVVQADLTSVDDSVRQELAKAKSSETQGDYFAALNAYVNGIHMYRIVKEGQELQPDLRQQIMSFEKRMDAFLKGIETARKSDKEGRLTSALYSYEQALGGLMFAPTRDTFERAYAKTRQLSARLEG